MPFHPRHRDLDKVFRITRKAARDAKTVKRNAKMDAFDAVKRKAAEEAMGRSLFEDPLVEGGKSSTVSRISALAWSAGRKGRNTQEDKSASSPSSPSAIPRPFPRGGRPDYGSRFSRGVRSGPGFSIRTPPPSSSSRFFFTSAAFSPPPFPAGTRAHSSVAERRALGLANKISADKEVDLRQIMDDLRDLELLDEFMKVKPKAATGYKDATRALYPLFHKLDEGEIKRVTFAQLQEALPPISTLPWTHIAERLTKGTNEKLAGLNAKSKAILLFMQVYSIGPTRAWKYADAGCKTLEDLERRQDSEKLKLTKAQKIGIRHREDIARLIPRSEMEKLKSALETALKAIDEQYECEILGSYRRGVDFSSDIDLVVRHPKFIDKDNDETGKPMIQGIVKYLEQKKLTDKEDQLMLGTKKYAGLIRLTRHKHYRRIDIRLAPYHSYPYMLLGSTGDSLLMKILRHVAKQKGMCLNEYGMGDKYAAEDQNPNGFKPGTLRVVKSEQEIFDLLGLPYLKPEEREYKVWKSKYEKARVPAMEYLYKL
ncbi:hypothetical protein JCM8547_003299 [Rhodosporidiobolus lusitaniae]